MKLCKYQEISFGPWFTMTLFMFTNHSMMLGASVFVICKYCYKILFVEEEGSHPLNSIIIMQNKRKCLEKWLVLPLFLFIFIYFFKKGTSYHYF